MHSARLTGVVVSLALFSLTAVSVSGGVAPADLCKDKKAKETGKKVQSLLKAFGKNLKTPNLGKLASDVSKAQSKFTKGFTKAEFSSSGGSQGCDIIQDADDIEDKADAFVEDVVDELDPPGPSTTSSTTTTTVTSPTTTTTPFQGLCAAAGITLPTMLPNQATCTESANIGCNGWTDASQRYEGPSELASTAPGPNATSRARFYKWESGVTTCFYLYRDNAMNAAKLNGVHCYNETNCKVCAFDLSTTVALPILWSQLKPADQSQGFIEDCSVCHASGPVAPKKKFWDDLGMNFLDPINCACGTAGGPTWIGAPGTWAQSDNNRRRSPPPSQYIGTCSVTNTTTCKESNECGKVCSITVATSCTVNADCPGGETCVSQTCETIGRCSVNTATVCAQDAECTKVCSITVATPCTVNADCPGGETCVSQTCTGKCSVTTATACTVNSDCPAPEFCSKGGQCSTTVATKCSPDVGTCPGGEMCEDYGHCSVTTAMGCTVNANCPGGETCVTDDNTNTCESCHYTGFVRGPDRCSRNDATPCTVNADCTKVCSRNAATACAVNADCTNVCSSNVATACAVNADCTKVCSTNVTTACTIDADCLSGETCVTQTCAAQTCEAQTCGNPFCNMMVGATFAADGSMKENGFDFRDNLDCLRFFAALGCSAAQAAAQCP